MDEEKKEEVVEDNVSVIEEIKKQYETTIANLISEHKEEIKQVRQECEANTIAQIKAIMSGRVYEVKQEPMTEELEPNSFEAILKETRQKLKRGK